MARLLAGRGIIFIDPLDIRLHRLAAPVYLRALDEADSLRDALLARSQELASGRFSRASEGDGRRYPALSTTWKVNAAAA